MPPCPLRSRAEHAGGGFSISPSGAGKCGDARSVVASATNGAAYRCESGQSVHLVALRSIGYGRGSYVDAAADDIPPAGTAGAPGSRRGGAGGLSVAGSRHRPAQEHEQRRHDPGEGEPFDRPVLLLRTVVAPQDDLDEEQYPRAGGDAGGGVGTPRGPQARCYLDGVGHAKHGAQGAPPADHGDTGEEHGPCGAAEHCRASAPSEAYERHEEESVEAGGGQGGRDTRPQPPRQRIGEPGQVRDRTEGSPQHRHSHDVAVRSSRTAWGTSDPTARMLATMTAVSASVTSEQRTS